MAKDFRIAPVFYTGAIILTILCGCAANKILLSREDHATTLANFKGFVKSCITGGSFGITSYCRFDAPGKTVRVYIEGDGRSWRSRRVLSDDPTPSNPVALYLAIEDDFPNVAYLARPGQYNSSHFKSCDPVYWSKKRFALEVIDAMNAAIDTVKTNARASDIELVGYSGGGAVAVLVAARRSDVVALRTVAGSLDPKALCAYHHVSSLDGSMNPLDLAEKVAHIPQRHFVGAKDTVVPAIIAHSFVEREGDKNYDRVTIVEGVTHTKGWQKRWRELLALPLL